MAKEFHGAISPEDAVDAKVLSEGPEAHRKAAKAPRVEPKQTRKKKEEKPELPVGDGLVDEKPPTDVEPDLP